MFDKIKKFEEELAQFTGAPYAIMTDCCTHAIELCLRHDRVQEVVMTPYTYLSIPMTMHKLGIKYYYREEEWIGEYRFHGTRIWDSARRLEPEMYRPGMKQCLSFGHGKTLQIGRGGRDLSILPWQDQKTFQVGYHYKPTPEEAIQGLALLQGLKEHCAAPRAVTYPDLRLIRITE
jgi:hypothetical protein